MIKVIHTMALNGINGIPVVVESSCVGSPSPRLDIIGLPDAAVKEAAEAAGMSKPSGSQIYYIDLSEGDSAVVYRQEEASVLSRLLTSLNHGVYAVVEYFD